MPGSFRNWRFVSRLVGVGSNGIDQTLQGRAFNKPPTAGSVASQVRSIADRNEALGLPPVSANAPEAFVTKDDASDAQHEESRIYGGQNPRGGMAAQMQVGRKTCGAHRAPPCSPIPILLTVKRVRLISWGMRDVIASSLSVCRYLREAKTQTHSLSA